MSDLTKFSDGASILQQVDVSDIFKNLAMGIAEAQQKLDDNSIAQAIKLAETQINGVSLLELGFAPVFYAFQYADISASINLQMALKESLEFGFGLEISVAKNKGYSEDTHNFLSEDSYSEYQEEYKTSRQVSFRAKEKNAVKINNKYVTVSQSEAAKSRVEKFKHDATQQTGVDQAYDEIHSRKLTNNQSRGVDVWMDGGFLRIEPSIHFCKTGVGILKIKDLNGQADADGGSTSFPLGGDMLNAVSNASSITGSLVYGISKSGDLFTYNGSTWIKVPSKLYFGYNSDEITYNKNLKKDNDPTDVTYTFSGGGAFTNKNHTHHPLFHKVLRLIQRHDPDAAISIKGMTDPKGGDNPKNKSLALRRAEKLRDHVFGSNAPVNIDVTGVTNAAGSNDLALRYAEITLDCDYLILVGGAIGEAATTDEPNEFVYLDSDAPNKFDKLNVQYGSKTLFAEAVSQDFSEIIDIVELSNHSYEETDEELHYYLDDEAIVKISLYTNQSDEIAIEHDDESSSEGTENSTTFLSSKSKNEKSILSDSLAKKSQDNSFAFGASVDFRMSRQFEMSMEGNASMAARLVSVPAPQAFVLFLQNTYTPTTTEE